MPSLGNLARDHEFDFPDHPEAFHNVIDTIDPIDVADIGHSYDFFDTLSRDLEGLVIDTFDATSFRIFFSLEIIDFYFSILFFCLEKHSFFIFFDFSWEWDFWDDFKEEIFELIRTDIGSSRNRECDFLLGLFLEGLDHLVEHFRIDNIRLRKDNEFWFIRKRSS